jgi:hypothetical protein
VTLNDVADSGHLTPIDSDSTMVDSLRPSRLVSLFITSA